MNILLIGHEGYLGRGLHEYFRRDHHVVGWEERDDLFTLDREFVRDQQFDVLVNLAIAADRASAEYRVDAPTDRVNVGGARHLARILAGSGVHWIQLSTREVLGPIYTEADVVRTDDGYRPR